MLIPVARSDGPSRRLFVLSVRSEGDSGAAVSVKGIIAICVAVTGITTLSVAICLLYRWKRRRMLRAGGAPDHPNHALSSGRSVEPLMFRGQARMHTPSPTEEFASMSRPEGFFSPVTIRAASLYHDEDEEMDWRTISSHPRVSFEGGSNPVTLVPPPAARSSAPRQQQRRSQTVQLPVLVEHHRERSLEELPEPESRDDSSIDAVPARTRARPAASRSQSLDEDRRADRWTHARAHAGAGAVIAEGPADDTETRSSGSPVQGPPGARTDAPVPRTRTRTISAPDAADDVARSISPDRCDLQLASVARPRQTYARPGRMLSKKSRARSR